MTAFSEQTTQDIETAARALCDGQLVVIPTETVYGLAADATNAEAVARIYDAKKRPQFNPLIVHVLGDDMPAEYADVTADAQALMARFWPGPLTLVLRQKKSSPLARLISAGLSSVALRAPAHPLAQQLIRVSKRPLAAPSANISGSLSPTQVSNVSEDIRTSAAAIIDGGPCRFGLESTVIGFDERGPLLLRPGAIARSEIEAITGPLLSPADDGSLGSPGRSLSHYAPQARLRLNAVSAEEGEALLAFGKAPTEKQTRILNLSESGDLVEAASKLFAHLAQLDKEGFERVAVMPIPQIGLGEAINDRIKRAIR